MRQILAQVHNRLSLGKRGENDAVQVLFPVIDGLTGALIVEREGDSQPYPVVTEVTDGYIAWTVNSYDTNVVGNVRAEVDYTDEAGTVVKSVTYLFRVSDSLSEPSEVVPDPYEDWYAKVLAESAAAKTAAGSAESAKDVAVSAQESAESAGTAAAESASTAGEKAGEASVSAVQAAESAVQAAESAEQAKQDYEVEKARAEAAEGELKEDLADKQDVLTDADKQAIADLHTDKVTDVQINGTSILADGVANVPMASGDTAGVVKCATSNTKTNGNAIYLKNGILSLATNSNYGIMYSDGYGVLRIVGAGTTEIDNKRADTNYFGVVLPSNLDYAVKAAMCDGKGAEWTAAEQAAARKRMGAAKSGKFELIETITVEDDTTTNIERTSEPSGAAYDFTNVIVCVSFPKTEAGNYPFYWCINSISNVIGYSGITVNTSYRQIVTANFSCDKGVLEGTITNQTVDYSDTTPKGDQSTCNSLNRVWTMDAITYICIRQTSSSIYFPNGTRVYIYAVRA